MLLLLLLLALPSSIRGAPSPNLSINAQVPPVARVDHPFDFVFSNSTFTSTAAISYAITEPPGWLQFDSPSRTFSGIPGMQDAGSFAIGLVATDGTGSTTMNVTFVVMVPPGPGLGTSVASQLADYGAFSSPDSLLLTPSSSLSLSFSPDTFTNTNQNTVYYALCADNTPLPSWIHFDPNSLTFSGITPEATSPSELPQSFVVQLTASDVAGFAGAIATFEVIVEGHLFAFSNHLQIINATKGLPVNYTGIWNSLFLDGQVISPTDIGQVVADAPSWLSLDQNSLALYGTPPSDVSTQNITVIATDCYGDNTSTVIQIQTTGAVGNTANPGGMLISPFPTLNATIGADFIYGFNNTLGFIQGVNISVDPGPASGWLAFNSSGLDIQGHVPSTLKPQSIQVDVTASQGNHSQIQVLTINVGASAGANTRTTSSASGTPSTSLGSAAQSVSKGTSHKGWIAAAVIVPLAMVAGIVLLLCCCCKRKWRLKLKFKIKSSEEKKEERKRKIRRLKVEEENQEDEPKTPLVMTGALYSDHEQASKAPRIHIPGLWKSGTNKRASNIRHSKATTNSTAQSRKSDPWQKYVGALESPRIMPSIAIVPHSNNASIEHSPARAGATDRDLEAATIAGPWSDDDPLSRRLSKRKKTGSRYSFGSSAKFSSHRVSGLGHGCNAMSQNSGSLLIGNRGVGHGDGQVLAGPPGHGIVTRSWRNYSLKRRGSLDSTRRGSWDSTASPSKSNDPVFVEDHQGSEILSSPVHKTLGSPLPKFPRPPTSSTFDQFRPPHIIPELSDDDEPPKITPPNKPLPRSRRGNFPTRQRSTTDPEPLKAFHKLRRQQNTSNPLWSSGELSQARKYSLHNRTSPKSSSNGDNKIESSGPRKGKISRSYSQSSSLEPRNPLSSSRSSNSVSGSPPRRKGSLLHNLNFTVRTLSLSSRGHDSTSSGTSSRFESAASLQFEQDENGDRRWRYADHPNPLTMNRASGTDVSDQELIDGLKSSGHFSAAQRLTYLKARTEGGGGGLGTNDDGGNAELNLRSSRGKMVGESMGLRREDTGLKSLRGEVGDIGVGSAFV